MTHLQKTIELFKIDSAAAYECYLSDSNSLAVKFDVFCVQMAKLIEQRERRIASENSSATKRSYLRD